MSLANVWWKRAGRGLAALALTGLIAGCAVQKAGEVYDPFEPVNRQVFAFNGAVDTMLLRPAAVVYRDLTPRPLKMVLGNFLSNLTLPLTIVHDLLQGKPDRAQIAVSRFFVNTIAGMGGLIDVATPHGLTFHDEDMGQTFAAHGSGPGPYLVLPLLGPSNLRDGIGTIIDQVIDPVSLVSRIPNEGGKMFRYYRIGATVVVGREALIEPVDALKQSLDYYATVRSAYSQRRRIDINDGKMDPSTPGQDPFGQAEKAGKSQ
jgi:phospholipid-binding lipoprotein MlaA